MSRIDWVVLERLASRIGVTLLLMFGVITLVESLNTWRFDRLAAVGGPWLGLSAILLNAALWTLSTLPVTLLVGAIMGLLDLQQRRELTVISSSGISVWQIVRAPLLAVMVAGVVLSLAADTAIVTMVRSISVVLPATNESGTLWMEQHGGGHDYILAAEHPHRGGQVLEEVTFFVPPALGGPRLVARLAQLDDGAWHVTDAVRFAPDRPPEPIAELRIPTASTPGDLGARLTSPAEMTIFELLQLQQISDPQLRSGVQMRLAKLLALPLALAASLLIAFAFTSGYRRTNKYGTTVLYGIVLGFVVYVVTEMAASAGSTGILQPAFAAFAPALVAIVVGTTVLLFKEDGQR